MHDKAIGSQLTGGEIEQLVRKCEEMRNRKKKFINDIFDVGANFAI